MARLSVRTTLKRHRPGVKRELPIVSKDSTIKCKGFFCFGCALLDSSRRIIWRRIPTVERQTRALGADLYSKIFLSNHLEQFYRRSYRRPPKRCFAQPSNVLPLHVTYPYHHRVAQRVQLLSDSVRRSVYFVASQRPVCPAGEIVRHVRLDQDS